MIIKSSSFWLNKLVTVLFCLYNVLAYNLSVSFIFCSFAYVMYNKKDIKVFLFSVMIFVVILNY